jgi:hypothetical protein
MNGLKYRVPKKWNSFTTLWLKKVFGILKLSKI